jgi:hypothetical protein
MSGVTLDGKKSYLQSSPLLDRLGVRAHILLKVLLCVECGYAHIPKAMAGHLGQKHKIPISEDNKKALLQFASTHFIANQPGDGPLPTNYGPPVELVREQAGFACGVGECPYAFRLQTTITNLLVE